MGTHQGQQFNINNEETSDGIKLEPIDIKQEIDDCDDTKYDLINTEYTQIKQEPITIKEEDISGICDESFATREQRSYHVKCHSKQYMCEVCGKCFAFPSVLKRHQRKHTVEKPYKCYFCGKSFDQIQSLQKHQSLHTGERPFKCRLCDKSFVTSTELQDHQRTHSKQESITINEEDVVKPVDVSTKQTSGPKDNFLCEICDKNFETRRKLYFHFKCHSKEYKCEVCGKCFPLPSGLKNHQRIHTGEKSYKCQFCNMCFNQLANLQQHQKVHKCRFCDESFVTSTELRDHQRTHINQEPITIKEEDIVSTIYASTKQSSKK